jgi:hypothetical protein
MELYKRLLGTACVTLLLSSAALSAKEQSAKEILDNAFTYIHNMDKYAFKAVVIDHEHEEDGSIKKYRFDASVKVDRPGKLRINVKGPSKDRSNYLNNGIYTMMDHQYNYYGRIKVPDTIDGALDYMFEEYGIRSPLAQLLYSKMHQRVKFKKSKNFGTRMVDGVECNYIAFSNDVREVHIWIATGDEPLIKAYRIIDKMDENDYSINTSITWDVHANISDSDFVFKAPKGAQKISVESEY